MVNRVSNKKNVFDKVQASHLQGLHQLSLESLIKDFIPSQDHFEYVKLSAFKDGLGYNLTSSEKQIFFSGDANLIGALKCSFRLTNVQLFNQTVKNFVMKLFEEFNLVVTANLYVTPNEDSQCFLYHGDPQDSLVYQLMGQKDWSFPVQDNEYAFLKPQLRADASAFNQNKLAYTDELHSLKKGMALTFPYHLVHKATNLESLVSVHLTFSVSIPNAFEIQNYILQNLLGIKDINDHFHEGLSMEELTQKLNTHKLEIGQLVKSFYLEFAESEKKLLHLGRRY